MKLHQLTLVLAAILAAGSLRRETLAAPTMSDGNGDYYTEDGHINTNDATYY